MPGELVVMTFNLRNDRALDGRHCWWRRRRAALAAITGAGPDLVGLQEARPLQVRYLATRLREHGAIGAGRDDGRRRGEHCLLLHRRDRLGVERWATRWFSDTPDVPGSRGWGNRSPRVATIAVLADGAAGGRRFGVVGTHLDERSAASRRRSADALAAWTAAEPGLPWIVLGDLNAIPGEAAVDRLLAAGLRDALAHLPSAGPGAATGHAFTGSPDGRRIDHILVSPEWEVLDGRVLRNRPHGRLPSDHWPVVARLRLRDPAP